MVKTIKREWLKTQNELLSILRWEEEGGAVLEGNHAALDQNKRIPMHKKVGLWIDRKKAIIVSIANNIEAKRIIPSDMEHYVLHSTVIPGDGSPEDLRDRRFWNHLGEYYDKIIEYIGDAEEIEIFGPDEAKYELQKRLEQEGLAEHISGVEYVGQLTDLQIANKVQKRFPLRSRFELL